MKTVLDQIPIELFILWGMCLIAWIAPETIADEPIRWTMVFLAKFTFALVVVSLLGVGHTPSFNPMVDAATYIGLSLAAVWLMDVGWGLASRMTLTS